MKNSYEIRGDVTAIFVKNKGQIFETLISTNKLPRAISFPHTWYASWCPSRRFYYVAGHLPRVNGKEPSTLLHRWIMQPPNDREIDHFDNDGLNNTDQNLRIVTHIQNLQNRTMQRNNTSGFRGVCYHIRRKKWQANVRIDGRQAYLGLFDNPEDAANAVIEARKIHMPFSKEAAGVVGK